MAKPARQKSIDPAPAPETVSAAHAAAEPGDWLSGALEHHDQIRAAFVAARAAPPGGARVAAMKGLAVVLNGHSIAEEIVLYPALAAVDGGKSAARVYDEQNAAKIQMAELERLSPHDEDWLGKLDEIAAAVTEHMEEEEATWFLRIKERYPDQAKLTARYRDEFERYTRTGAIATNGA